MTYEFKYVADGREAVFGRENRREERIKVDQLERIENILRLSPTLDAATAKVKISAIREARRIAKAMDRV